MRLFVTGGTGFIGTHFVAQAMMAGHEVKALRRPGSVTRLPLKEAPEWIDGALDDDWRAELKGCEVLVHLAAHTANPPYAPLHECLHWNVCAPLRLAQHAWDVGIRRFLIAGSCFEYGRVADTHAWLGEDSPIEPLLSYPASKAAATVAFGGFAREHSALLKVLRVFQAFGEGEAPGRLWPSLRRAALSGDDFPMTAGEQLRDFMAVQDVARAFVAHLDFDGVKPGDPQIHHVCSGRPQSLLDFASHWWAHWGATGRLLPGAIDYRQGEIMRLLPRQGTCMTTSRE
jgi:UDP-glucose 4-epimerase